MLVSFVFVFVNISLVANGLSSGPSVPRLPAQRQEGGRRNSIELNYINGGEFSSSVTKNSYASAAAATAFADKKKIKIINSQVTQQDIPTTPQPIIQPRPQPQPISQPIVQQQQKQQTINLHGLEELAPLERQMLRMEGLRPYVLVSVLTSTTSYGTITGTSMLKDGAVDMISSLLLATSTVSTICGVYSTVVFSMSMLYGFTAIGLNQEKAYYYFMEKTSVQRSRGFQAFKCSLQFFVADIFLIGVDKMPEDYQIAGGIVAVLATIFGGLEFETIVKGAAPMFSSDETQTIPKK